MRFMPMIPATQEKEVGGTQSKTKPRKSIRTCLKNNQNKKYWGNA
jgi:hypothetical protein